LDVRRPAVAGSFYPSDREELKRMMKSLFKSIGFDDIPKPNLDGERRITALISPHAGYVYSGRTAAAGYAALASDGIPETFVILGPNHTGLGAAFSASSARYWETPLGLVEIDRQLTDAIRSEFEELTYDDLAHMSEHSIEVQIPFLQLIYDEVKVVPITMSVQNLEESVRLGRAIALAAEKTKRDVVIIASSDMSHYLPEEEARRRDMAALEAILDMDVHSLFRTLFELDVSMCGPGPASVAITFSKLMGVEKGELIRYSTSAEASGDRSFVVGYASVVFRR